MIVVVTDDAVEVEEPDDCSRLHIASGLEHGPLAEQLEASELGALDGPGAALLDVEVLSALAGGSASAPDWSQRWDRMIAYAARKGWTTDDGRFLRAHVEPR